MKIENGCKVKVVHNVEDSYSIPKEGTILTVVGAEDTNFHPPKSAPYCVNSEGAGVWVRRENLEVVKEEPVKSALDTQHLITFTTNHKNLEISIEGGKIVAKYWIGNGDPVEYSFDTLEQLEEFTNAWDIMRKYHHEQT